jgi:hypothetical protein
VRRARVSRRRGRARLRARLSAGAGLCADITAEGNRWQRTSRQTSRRSLRSNQARASGSVATRGTRGAWRPHTTGRACPHATRSGNRMRRSLPGGQPGTSTGRPYAISGGTVDVTAGVQRAGRMYPWWDEATRSGAWLPAFQMPPAARQRPFHLLPGRAPSPMGERQVVSITGELDRLRADSRLTPVCR